RGFTDARGATMLTRALPLMPAGVPIGALVLVRDITEVRRRDRALITKDATIREIHHRVKNNLQTVAALLRLQARRVAMPEARVALEESVRRVASIALVHETLSMSSDEAVEFDGIVDRVASAATEVAATEVSVGMRRRGTFGVLPAEIATSLVMVLNELLLNAVEHGFPPADEDAGPAPADAPRPEVVVSTHRARKQLHVAVTDNGRGLPEQFDAERGGNLGLQIVRALVTGELRGTIALRNGADGGTEATIVVPLARGTTDRLTGRAGPP
ncbi:sensor histidine kinase, partial [Micromonospora sp. NPDC005313]|uniref:sensor histidine kinase n=1 Tax=Micromonospora sp. NPDC005313 TaxID=3154296 RepID=UPI0033B2C930